MEIDPSEVITGTVIGITVISIGYLAIRNACSKRLTSVKGENQSYQPQPSPSIENEKTSSFANADHRPSSRDAASGRQFSRPVRGNQPKK